jgi:hypothetical protein
LHEGTAPPDGSVTVPTMLAEPWPYTDATVQRPTTRSKIARMDERIWLNVASFRKENSAGVVKSPTIL